MEAAWPSELNDYLQQVTRELQFDWGSIGKAVSNFVIEKNIEVGFDITPSICRIQFSNRFDHSKYETALKEVSKSTDPKMLENEQLSSSTPLNMSNIEHLSLDELIQYVNEREVENEKRKEALFKRVLDSLGGNSSLESEQIHDVVTSAFKQSTKEKEKLKRLQEKQAAESEENKRLLEERKKLKDRFAPDSVDQEGSNLLPFYPLETSINEQSTLENEVPILTAKFEDIIDNDFDALLTDLEREFELQAPGKQEGSNVANEELADVLNILDQAASTKRKEIHQKNLVGSKQPVVDYVPSSSSFTSSSSLKVSSQSAPSPVALHKREHIPTEDDDQSHEPENVEGEEEEEVKEDEEESDSEPEVSESSDDEDWKHSRAAIRGGGGGYSTNDNTRTISARQEPSRFAAARGSQIAVIRPETETFLPPPIPNAEELIIGGQESKEESQEINTSINGKGNEDSIFEESAFENEVLPVVTIPAKFQSKSGSLLSASRSTRSVSRPSSVNKVIKKEEKEITELTSVSIEVKNSLLTPPPESETDFVSVGPTVSFNEVTEAEHVDVPALIESSPDATPLPHIHLEDIAAPRLHSLPWNSLHFDGSVNLDSAKLTRLVIAEIEISRVDSRGDANLSSILSWFVEFAHTFDCEVVGLQSGTLPKKSETGEGKLDCHPSLAVRPPIAFVILQAKDKKNIDLHKIQGVLQYTTLEEAALNLVEECMEGVSRPTSLEDCVSIFGYEDGEIFSEKLKIFHSNESNFIGLPFGTLEDVNAEHSKRIAVSVFKEYILLDRKGSAIRQYLKQCEEVGLRICGFRIAYIDSTELSSSRRYLPYSVGAQKVGYEYHGPFFCIAFCSTSTLSWTSNVTESSTASLLRSLIGPDDPALARKTDPKSVRAIFGENKEKNVLYPIPYSNENVRNELLFWFGSRVKGIAEKADNPNLRFCRTYMKPQRLFCIGVSIKSLTGSLYSLVASALTDLQLSIYNLIRNELSQHSSFSSLQSVSLETLQRRFGRSERSGNGEQASSSLNFILSFDTLAGDLCLHRIQESLQSHLAQLLSQQTFWTAQLYFRSVTSAADGTSSLPNELRGSKLAALTAAKSVEVDDFKSHEDVGLPDVVVLLIQNVPSSDQLNILSNILQCFPKFNEAMVIGVKSSSSHENIMLACLRAYQLLENIDGVVDRVNKSLRGATSSCKIIKGKRALELISLEFAVEDIYSDVALGDIRNYYSAVDGFNTSDVSDISQLSRILFPNGVCELKAVILLPFKEGLSQTRNLAKVLSRLEKEQFEITDFKASLVHSNIIHRLIQDSLNEYSYDSSTAASYSIPFSDVPCLAIAVKRNSALLKLKHLVGPVLSEELANLQYPKSLAAALLSQKQSSSSTGSDILPALLCSLSNSSAAVAISSLFPSRYVKDSDSEHIMSVEWNLNSSYASGSSNSSQSTQFDFALLGLAANNATESFAKPLNGAFESRSIALKSVSHAPNSVEAIRAKSSDIAGIVITHSLIKQVGLSEIVEILHREGFRVINGSTTFLLDDTARTLAELAGASSLTLRPSLPTLRAGPVVMLGVEGPCHAFIRFKSFSLSSVIGKSKDACVWKLSSGEWGVLASTSPRLAKLLFKYCFSEIFDSSSVFEITLDDLK